MSKQTQLWIKEICALGDFKNSDWKNGLKISPIGKVTGIDGRTFSIDGEAALQELNDNGLKLVLNVDHGWTAKYGSEAAGWFADFELKDDGIYAKLELNKLGNKLLEAQAYKYLSPEFLTDEFKNVVAIVGVGLVNQPNLLNQALNKQQHDTGEQDMSAKNNNDDKNDTNAEQMQRLKDENNALKLRIEASEKDLREQKINNAIKDGALIPAKKDFALALDANALDSFLKIEAESKPAKANNNLNPDAEKDDYENDEILSQLGL
ncbi:MAG: hypothetical protein JKY87_00285 [Mariprofundus sp.]|nr:hypothetical protein [Mariprofundus sp.]